MQFGVFELDLQRADLRKNGVKVKLQEQPLKILQVLLENPGQIVSREDLRQRIWPANTFVEFDQGLYSAMARLRDALGDSSDSPRFVETVAKRGYRFIAPVKRTPGEQNDGTQPPEKAATNSLKTPGFQRWMGSLIAGLMGGALLLATVLTFNVGGLREWLHSRTTPIGSIAVLPLENLSNDPEQEYFADGMTDELITRLAKLGTVRVVSRTSVMRYKRTTKTLPEIGKELNVDAVVEGTVERSGSRVRIRVQLVQAATDRDLWAETYDREFRDSLGLESQAASDIVHEIHPSLTPSQKRQLASVHSPDPQAHEAYLKGLYFMNKRTATGAKRAIEYYQDAIAKDPNFALAYADLSECYLGLYLDHIDPEASLEGAKRAALRAAELDSGLAEAHLALAGIREVLDWDWAESEREFKRALELNPNSAVAHQGNAMVLIRQGNFDEALIEAQRSQDLDPVSPFIRSTYCLDLRFARHYDEAIQKCREALDLDPEFAVAHRNLARTYEAKGLISEAIEEHLRAAALEGRPEAQVADARKAFAASGSRGFWREFVQQEESRANGDPYRIAECYSRLKETEPAIKWLEKAYQQHSPHMWALNREETFDYIRSDPRFQDLLRRLRLQ